MASRVPLECLEHERCLLVCSELAEKKKKCVLWVRKEEWELLIMCVVLPFYVHSTSLKCLRVHGAHRNEVEGDFEAKTRQLLDEVTPGNCFLQHPDLVTWNPLLGKGTRHNKPWHATKRHRELQSVCIKPAARSKIQHATVAKLVREDPAYAAMFIRDTTADRRVVWWENQGRIELKFNLDATAIKVAVAGKNQWRGVAEVRLDCHMQEHCRSADF